MGIVFSRSKGSDGSCVSPREKVNCGDASSKKRSHGSGSFPRKGAVAKVCSPTRGVMVVVFLPSKRSDGCGVSRSRGLTIVLFSRRKGVVVVVCSTTSGVMVVVFSQKKNDGSGVALQQEEWWWYCFLQQKERW